LHLTGASVADVRDVDLRRTLADVDGTGHLLEADDPAAYRQIVEDIVREIPAWGKELVSERLSVLEPGTRSARWDARQIDQWQQERFRSLSAPKRADIIARLACAADAAPHVARGLLQNGRLRDTEHHLHDIATKMREGKTDTSKCAGVKGFLDADWEQLEELVKAAPPKPDATQPNAGK
jgi:hypothetical protein